MKRTQPAVTAAVLLLVLVLAGCSSTDDPAGDDTAADTDASAPGDGDGDDDAATATDDDGPDDGADADVASGGTFIKAIGGDPGSLNPVQAVSPDTFEVITYAYETLVYVTPDGDFEPWLAESWEESATEVVFTMRDDITCADGTPFDAQAAADNINYQADPDNATFFYGSQVTEAISATAEGDDLIITSTDSDPFLMVNTGTIQMVCPTGLEDPDALADSTDGTGLFVLSDVQAQSSYTFTKREDYTWGPDGVTSDTPGLPDEVELRVIADESTAVNLLLSGDIHAATVLGADRDRLDAAGLDFGGVRNPVGEMLFNERPERPTSDPLVREALAIALDRDEVGTVVAGGDPLPSRSLVVKAPLLCVADEPDWTLPDTDLERAGELLDEAGWTLGDDGLRARDGEPLTIRFIYDAPTSTHAPAAELVQQTWNQLGITTELTGNDGAAWSEQLFESFDWDTGWIQIAPGGPVLLRTFFAGDTPEDGGLNFMFVDNPEYNELAAEAAQTSPDDTCGLWRDAERELIERFDVFPLADNILPVYMSGATFEVPNFITPTSIRMLG